MPSTSFRLPACLAIVLAAACAAPAVPAATTPRGISGEIREDMDQARREMRADLAAARAELVQGNLELGQSPAVARRKAPAADAPPKGEITPAGDLLVDGRAVDLDSVASLAYRAQVVNWRCSGSTPVNRPRRRPSTGRPRPVPAPVRPPSAA